MKPPCMVVVQYILPALRVAIAKKLSDDYQLKKIEIAERMDVTPSAITQYLNRSRGDTASTLIEQSSRALSQINEIAADLAEGEINPDLLLLKMCRVCRFVRAEGLICDLHMEAMPSLRGVEVCACSHGLLREGIEN